jgi:putative transposase
LTVEQKRMAINVNHRRIPVSRQCELLELWRSSWYYRAQGDADEAVRNDRLMRMIDRQHLLTPFFGVARMTQQLRREGRGSVKLSRTAKPAKVNTQRHAVTLSRLYGGM